MKVDTICTYILVYLLTCVRFNVLVKVNAIASHPASTSSYYSTSGRSTKTGLDLNIKSSGSSKYDCNKNGQYVTYTSKGNNAFKIVKEDSTELWQATDSSQYSVIVEVDLIDNDSKAVTIHLPGNKTKVFKKDGCNKLWKEIDTSKVNPKSFNIDHQYETYFFTNVLNNNFRTFTAKTGFGFKGAIEYFDDKMVEIWKTDQESEYANRIEVDYMNNDSKAVTLYFSDNKTRLFIKHNKNEHWIEVDITKVTPMVIDTKNEYQSYFNTYRLVKDVRTFESKTGFLFNKVKDSNTDIWTTTDESEYAKKVEYVKRFSGVIDVTIHLNNGLRKLFLNDSDYEAWKEIDITKINYNSVNINYEHETHRYKNELKGNFRTFTAKTGFTFDAVKDGNTSIWTTNEEDGYTNKVDVDILNNNPNAITIYFPENKTKVFMKDSKNKSWTQIDTTEVNAKQVYIDYPHECYYYKNDVIGKIRTFRAKKGFIFNGANEIVNGAKHEIWKTEQESEYANKIVNENNNKLSIYVGEGSSYPSKLFVKGSNGQWIEKVPDLTQTSSRPQSSSSKSYTFTSKTGVDLNIKSATKSTDNFEYQKVGQYVTYTSKGNNAFKIVKEDSTELWQATDSSQYSVIVEVDLIDNDSKAVTIHLPGNKTKVFKKDGSNKLWKEIDTNGLDPKSVYVDYEYESYVCNYQSKNKFKVFTAKTGFIFKGAHEYINNKRVSIWSTTNENEYANKIEVDTMNNDAKAVIIHSPGNKNKLFTKDQKNGPWTEIDITKVNPKSINIDYPHECYLYKNELIGKMRTFEARDGFAFNNVNEFVNNKKIEIWKSDKESEYANRIEVDYMNNDSKAVTLYFSDNKTRLFMKHGINRPWNEIDITKINPKSVNIQYPHDSFFYTNRLDNDVRTFESKTGFLFNNVSEGNTSIWSTATEANYSNKVEFAKRYSDKLDVTIHKSNGKKILYLKESSNEAWKMIDINKVNPMSMNIRYEHETYYYSNKLQESTRTFEARHGFAFNVVNEYIGNNRLEIWSTSNEEYAKKVVAEKNNKVFIYIGDNGNVKVFNKGTNGIWTEDTSTPTLPAAQAGASTTQPRVRLLKVNPSDANNPLELDANEYTSITSGSVVAYKIANGVNCAQLIIDDVLLWLYDPNQRSGRYPQSLYHDTNTDVLLLRFAGLDLTFSKNAQGQWTFTESGPLLVKFHIIDPNNPNNTVELPSSYYTVTESGDITTFNIADNVNTFALTYGSVLLWQHNPSQYGGRYPKSLVYTISTDTLVLRFVGLDIKFTKNIQGLWEYTEHTSSSGAAPTPPAAQTGASTTQPRVRLLKVNPSDPSSLMALSANDFSSSTSGNVVAYKIANGVNCAQLIIDDVLLWLYDPNQRSGRYPQSLYHDTNTDVLLLRFAGLDLTFSKNAQGQWTFTESGPLLVKFHIIDPNNPNNTVELPSSYYTVTESGDITTFNIADNVNTFALTYGSVLLWQHNPSQYGGRYPKSLVYTISTDTLVLRFVGLDIKFTKNIQGLWEYTEHTSSSGAAPTPPAAQTGASTTQPRVRLLKVNPSDPSSLMALSANDFSSSTSGNVVAYKIANGVNCAQLIIDDVLLWLYDPNQRSGRYPQSLYHDTNTDVLLLRFAGLDLTFSKNAQGQWQYSETIVSGQ